jgi:hypothetical protein
MSAITATMFCKSSVQWRLICALPDVPTQWTSGESEIPRGAGLAGVVSVKFLAEPEESHSMGRTGAPLAPVTCTRAAAPPSPGNTPGGAGASVSELPSDAVITSSPATLRVMPELVPGIVTGESESMGAVNVLGAEVALKGTLLGQSVHPSKLKVMLPLSE